MKRVDVVASPEIKSATQIYVDAFGHFAAAYGEGKGDYMLIRPDGYVGWIGSPDNLPSLDEYPSRVSVQ